MSSPGSESASKAAPASSAGGRTSVGGSVTIEGASAPLVISTAGGLPVAPGAAPAATGAVPPPPPAGSGSGSRAPPSRPSAPSTGSSSKDSGGGSPDSGPQRGAAQGPMRPLLTLEHLSGVSQRLRGGDFSIHPAALALKQDWNAEMAVNRLSELDIGYATANKINMLGIAAEQMLAAMLQGLIAARETGDVVSYLKDMVIGANMGPTIARSRVAEYNNLGEASIYKQYEIADRTADLESGKRGEWVEGCDMNATAVRWVGQIIVCFAAETSFLGKVAKKTGTFLNPPGQAPPAPLAPGEMVTREHLLWEAHKQATPAFRAQMESCRATFAKTMEALDLIYGSAGPELSEAIRVASGMVGYEI